MRIVGIDWDSGNWPKCGKHGVSKSEIEDILLRTKFSIADPYPYEARFFTANEGLSGRYVFLVYTVRTKEGKTYLRPISARYMHAKEIEKYEKAKTLAKSKK